MRDAVYGDINGKRRILCYGILHPGDADRDCADLQRTAVSASAGGAHYGSAFDASVSDGTAQRGRADAAGIPASRTGAEGTSCKDMGFVCGSAASKKYGQSRRGV